MEKETKGNRRGIVPPGRTRMENADRERGHNSVPGPKCCDIVARQKGFLDSMLVHCLLVSAGGCSWNTRGVRNGDIGKCEIFGGMKKMGQFAGRDWISDAVGSFQNFFF